MANQTDLEVSVSQTLATTQIDVANAALTWAKSGCSVIPIAANGTKRPMIEWSSAMQYPATLDYIKNWFIQWPGAGIGLVCGSVSGNLEMLELEGRATSSDHLDKVVQACQKRGVLWLWDMLTQQGYAEWTPSGGIHLIYRVVDEKVPRNTKLARDAQSLCLAETRGEGGYVVVAPTGGGVHKTGGSWDVAAGEIGVIPTVNWDDRCALHEAIREALDETPPPPPMQRRPIMAQRPSGAVSPGDDFSFKASWHDILEPHGWKAVKQSATETFWLHPNSTSGASHSASTGYSASGDRLYVWSSSTPFTPETPYSKFAAYAVLEHAGNFSAAAKDLSAKGYGTPLERSAPSAARVLLDSVETTQTTPADLESTGQAIPHTEAGNTSSPVGWNKDFPAPSLTVEGFLQEEFSLQGAGNLFAQAYENTFRFCENDWWFWTGKVWRKDKRLRFEQAAKSIIDIGRIASREATLREEGYAKKLSSHISKMANAQNPALVRWARSDPRISMEYEDFDAQGHLVALENGCFNLDTMTLEDHNPRNLVTRQMPVIYDKDATAPKWEAFLAQAVPDPEIRSYLQRAMGHTLLGDAEQRALYLLHGPSGTGKSQFIRAMELLFGDFAETATPATFNGSSKTATLTNDLNDLKGKRFVSVSELDEGEVLNESLVKRLTGGDTAKSRGLWQENSKWRVQFTMWLATNNLPRLSSDDNAIWRRVKPIPFTHVAEDNGGEILRLAEKIFAAEASGILNWVLAGVEAYRLHGLPDPESVKEAVAAYKREVDVVEQFISERLEEGGLITGEGLEIQSSRLHAIFVEWCARNGIKGAFSQRRFSQRLDRMGRFSRRKTSGSVYWVGITASGHHGVLGTMT